MPSRWEHTDGARGDDYDARWAEMAERGENPHGEVDFVDRLQPAGSVLDAGCGTGRVAIELARRGRDVVGVDLDSSMLDTARRNGPALTWVRADLATLDLGRTFDVVVMAGNVMIFVEGGSEGEVLARMAAHLVPGGLLVAGFQLGPDRLSPADYDRLADGAGLDLEDRFATWDGDPWPPGDHTGAVDAPGSADYAVSVHRLPA